MPDGADIPHIQRRGLLFVLSSPSGAGKTSLAQMLQASDKALSISVSVTTRRPRPTEKDGHDYRFVDSKTFEAMRKQGAFLESAKVFGHDYGTPKALVEEKLAQGQDVLFDVDWQGRQQLAGGVMGADVVSVFILPPSASELAYRLATRAQDTAKERSHRMQFAPDEISHYAEYDYIVVNRDLNESLAQLKAILAAERAKRIRQTGLTKFVDDLIEKL